MVREMLFPLVWLIEPDFSTNRDVDDRRALSRINSEKQ